MAALIAATEGDRTQNPSALSLATVRVVYQNSVPVTWNGATASLIGRTLEEAFALQNLAWCQQLDKHDLGLRIRRNDTKTLADLFERIHKRIKRKDFKKTDFALALLGQDSDHWTVPRYIDEGLKWLESQVVPVMPAPPRLEPGIEEVQA